MMFIYGRLGRAVGSYLLIAVLVTAATGCSAATRLLGAETTTGPQPLTLLLVDISGSSRDWRRTQQMNLNTTLARVAAERGRVVVRPIDSASAAHAAAVVDVSFAVADQGNALKRTRLQKQAHDQVIGAVEELVAHAPPTTRTDAFGALSAARSLVAQVHDDAIRIVLLSDMVNTVGGPHYDLSTHAPCTVHDRAVLIRRLRTDHLLPDLRGVAIWVGGAGLRRSNTVSAKQSGCLEATWRAVLAATGADLQQYQPNLDDRSPR